MSPFFCDLQQVPSFLSLFPYLCNERKKTHSSERLEQAVINIFAKLDPGHSQAWVRSGKASPCSLAPNLNHLDLVDLSEPVSIYSPVGGRRKRVG